MHIGLIMDGNGRWATQRSLPRASGHVEGLKAANSVIDAAINLKIDFLTLYVFSTENWKRPKQEVDFLMKLLAEKLPEETEFCLKKNVRILFRGNIAALGKPQQAAINDSIEKTSACTGLTVVLCVNYGGHDEIVRAVNRYIEKNPGRGISPEDIQANLDTPSVPAPDIIARSAGEMRLSNFMLWDSAYAEFFSVEKLWPDWGKEELELILNELSHRVRKFGGLAK